MDVSSRWIQTGSIACQVRKYFARRTTLAPRKMPGSGKTYLRSSGEQYCSSTREGSSLTAAKALDQAGIDNGAMGRSVDELVSRYTVQCTTQKQNKTPRVYKARQYTRCTCKMSSATSCSVQVPRGSYVNKERVAEKACLRALCREMMED